MPPSGDLGGETPSSLRWEELFPKDVWHNWYCSWISTVLRFRRRDCGGWPETTRHDGVMTEESMSWWETQLIMIQFRPREPEALLNTSAKGRRLWTLITSQYCLIPQRMPQQLIAMPTALVWFPEGALQKKSRKQVGEQASLNQEIEDQTPE